MANARPAIQGLAGGPRLLVVFLAAAACAKSGAGSETSDNGEGGRGTPGSGGDSNGAGGDPMLGSGGVGGGVSMLGGNGGVNVGGAGGIGHGGQAFIPDAGAPDAPIICIPQTTNVAISAPTLLVVMDRSGSMMRTPEGTVPAAGQSSRWALAAASVRTIWLESEIEVAWGMKMFPTCRHSAQNINNPFNCEFPVGTENTCATQGMEYSPATGQSALLSTALSQNTPFLDAGSTPTRSAVQAAVAMLQQIPRGSGRYLVLLTDGAPNCGVYTGTNCVAAGLCDSICTVGQTCVAVEDSAGATGAVAAAAVADSPVFVVGVGLVSQANTFHANLNALAIAGGRPRADPSVRYYLGNDRATLESSLRAITQEIRGCQFAFAIPQTGQITLQVTVGQSPVVDNPTDGFSRLPNGTGIELHGVACAAIKAGGAPTIQITTGCPP